MSLADRIALVTGAGSGIGLAIAERFVAAGARVVMADIVQDAVEAAAGRLGPPAVGVVCDVGDSSAVQRAVDTAVAQFGGLDILVNNAGGTRPRPLVSIEDQQWRRALETNLSGVFYGIRHAAPVMASRGGGSIISTSSIAATRPAPGMAAYSTAKAGVEALTRAAALELRGDGIRVNAIVPGMISTPGVMASRAALEDGFGTSDLDDHVEQRQGRWGGPEEVAAVALHLASDEASFTTGLLYVVDNGHSIG